MKTKRKTLDCVEMMHKGALRIFEDTKGMTIDEELVYWRSRERHAAAKRKRPSGSKATSRGAK